MYLIELRDQFFNIISISCTQSKVIFVSSKMHCQCSAYPFCCTCYNCVHDLKVLKRLFRDLKLRIIAGRKFFKAHVSDEMIFLYYYCIFF